LHPVTRKHVYNSNACHKSTPCNPFCVDQLCNCAFAVLMWQPNAPPHQRTAEALVQTTKGRILKLTFKRSPRYADQHLDSAICQRTIMIGSKKLRKSSHCNNHAKICVQRPRWYTSTGSTPTKNELYRKMIFAEFNPQFPFHLLVASRKALLRNAQLPPA